MNNKKKKLLNVIDIIIIAVLIIGVAAAGFIFLRPGQEASPTGETQYIDFTIELPTVKNKFKNLVKQYDPVLETVRHTSMGYVSEVIYEDAEIATTDILNGGIMKMTAYPDHTRATITIRAPYSFNENGEYSVNGTAVAVGAFINFSTPSFITSGYCIKVNPLTAQQNKEWESMLKEIGGNK